VNRSPAPIPVYCWTCTHEMRRSPKGNLLDRCPQCGSSRTHVTRDLDACTVTTRDLPAMLARGRVWVRAERAAKVAAALRAAAEASP